MLSIDLRWGKMGGGEKQCNQQWKDVNGFETYEEIINRLW